MKLTHVRIKKFKKIRDIQIPLGDLNILVGANGSGKSSVLQALHLATNAIRQAPRALEENKSSTIPVNEIDYLPTEEYARLGNGAPWGNTTTSASSRVAFRFKDDEGSKFTAFAEIRAARNAGISVYGSIPASTRFLRAKQNFFSAYIPGISGVPHKEQKYSKRVVLRSAAAGDANSYLRNALHLIGSRGLQKVQSYMAQLIGNVEFKVSHSNESDIHIKASAKFSGREIPLELLGTGYLQLLQIFCYVVLFKPKLLLIDEPDIHLHPSVQEALPSVLKQVAADFDLKIILSTHSPFIVRGAPISTAVHWLENGQIKNSSRQAVELALGWGAFGKKVVLVSEDAKNDFLKKLLSQWPEIDAQVTVLPGRGYKNLLKSDEARELRETLGNMFHVVVHRDRDSLTDEEMDKLKASYDCEGVSLWITDGSDLEAYFCNANVIRTLAGCSQDDAQNYLDGALTNQQANTNQSFTSQRAAINEELYKEGGSPTNDEARASLQGRILSEAKGKSIFRRLKDSIPSNKFGEKNVLGASYDVELAESLKNHILGVLNP